MGPYTNMMLKQAGFKSWIANLFKPAPGPGPGMVATRVPVRAFGFDRTVYRPEAEVKAEQEAAQRKHDAQLREQSSWRTRTKFNSLGMPTGTETNPLGNSMPWSWYQNR